MQVLYLEHSVQSLALGGPWRLGTLCKNSSAWRILSEADTVVWGGSSMRRLYGCVITLVTEHTLTLPLPSGSNSLAAMAGPDNLFRQVLLSWSQVLCSEPHARKPFERTAESDLMHSELFEHAMICSRDDLSA